MAVTCPKCGAAIGPEGVNVARDVAYCAACGEGFNLSATVPGARADSPKTAAVVQAMLEANLDRPPPGCWFARRPDGFEVGAALRTTMSVIMVVAQLAGILFVESLVVAIFAGTSADSAGPPRLFLIVPAVIFVPATIWQVTMLCLILFGRVRVTLEGGELRVFTGVGSLGRTRTMPWSEVRSVRDPPGPLLPIPLPNRRTAIMVEGQRPLALGSMLPADRQCFIVAALRQALVAR